MHNFSVYSKKLTALSFLRLVGVVEAVVVAVANVDPWNAVSVVAGEEISVASPVSGCALVGRLVFAPVAIAVSVTVPRCRNASVVGTSKGEIEK